VLPLWPNQLLVTLGAGHVALLYRSGLTKKTLAQREATVHASNEHPWADALSVLEQLLEDITPTTNTHLHISLTSDLVRYLVLPPSFDSIAQSDKLAYAQAAFRETFGNESLGWAIQCHDAAPTEPTVCAAIDQSLLDALQALTVKRKLSLTSVQPYFVSAINALSAHLNKSEGIVIVVENARLVLATFKHGACTQLRSQVLMNDWQQHLPEVLARTLLLEEEVARIVSIYAPAHKTNTLSPIKDWQTKRLGVSAKSSILHPPYAMLEVML
jgi:hypothetical protein